jgi:hypothetical protein
MESTGSQEEGTPSNRVSQPGFRRTLGFREMSLGVPQEIVIEKISFVARGNHTKRVG